MSTIASARHAARRPGYTRGVAVAGLVALVLLVAPGLALAHTAFESSSPANGDVIDTPVDVVTIRFTAAAEPAGEGFAALDASGTVRKPTEVIAVDERTFDLRFDPALAGGQVGIRWMVRAGDAHPIEGGFAFTVTAPAVAPPTVPPTTTPAPPASTPGSAAAVTSPPTTASAAVAAPTTSSTGAATSGDTPIALDEFLAISTDGSDGSLGSIGRTITLLAVAIGLGALAFCGTALRGTRAEVRGTLTATRIAGGLVALGAVIEYIALVDTLGDSAASTLTTAAGIAVLLRLVGGVALAAGLASTIVSTRPPVQHALSAAVATPIAATGTPEPRTDASFDRWAPDRRSIIGFGGAALIVMSFWFDGHTVTEGWRPLHAIVDSIHVVAGSVWVGGVVTMAALLWIRHRAGRAGRTHQLVVRFSPIATVALLAVAAAGLAMAAMVLDSPRELFSTEWGQILLLKTAAVAIAAGIGAYNHFRLRPALDAAPDDERLEATVRTSITVEAIVLLFVVVVTAALVVAATI